MTLSDDGGTAGDGVDTLVTDFTVEVDATPVAVADSYATSEDVELVIDAESGVLANDSDGDGDTLVAVLDADVANGTYYRVHVGPFEQQSVAINTMTSMKRIFGFKDPFVLKKQS